MTPDQAALLDAANEDFQHFLDLAFAGVSASASDAEHAACLLSDAAIEKAQHLSSEALAGFCQFVAIAHRDADVARMLLS